MKLMLEISEEEFEELKEYLAVRMQTFGLDKHNPCHRLGAKVVLTVMESKQKEKIK